MAVNLLGQKLRELRGEVGESIPEVARQIGVDRRHLWWLESQPGDWLERTAEGRPFTQPARDLIIRVAIAQRLTIDQTDELLLIAGYATLFPLPRRI
jgi:transcriptional regulator with XRE-family HTH domain